MFLRIKKKLLHMKLKMLKIMETESWN